MRKSRSGLLAATAITMASLLPPATARAQENAPPLNLALAVEAATEAVASCAAQGWSVSASVVDISGTVKVQLKGDHSTVHTQTSSFRKAYTTVTMAPIFHFDTLGEWVTRLKDAPSAPALATLPDILLLAGAVAVRQNGQIVAAIGVGGAPGGDKDEACAAAGLAKIADRLLP